MPPEPNMVTKPFEVIVGGAERLSRSVLGTLALFLLLIYFTSGITLMFSTLSERSQTILVLFVALFPLVVLMVFYNLVTKHFGTIIDPGNLAPDVTNQIALKFFGIEAQVRGRAEEGAEARKAQKELIDASESAEEPSRKREIDRVRDWYSSDWRQKRYLFRRTSENYKEQPEIVFSDAKVAKDITSIFQFIDDIGAAIADGDLKDSDLPADFKKSVSRYGRRGKTWLQWLRKTRTDLTLFNNFEVITERWAAEMRGTPVTSE